ncbi:hypothetical protein B7767_13280 [Streptomyces sp. 13-12-16]|nr:hypothetical protein B7767_13280 [Streptomyces sp. 13-12-16]
MQEYALAVPSHRFPAGTRSHMSAPHLPRLIAPRKRDGFFPPGGLTSVSGVPIEPFPDGIELFFREEGRCRSDRPAVGSVHHPVMRRGSGMRCTK